VISALPDTVAADLIAQFQRHGFKSLPVVTPTGALVGLIPLSALLGADPAQDAASLAKPATPLPPDARLPEVIGILADGRQPAVPIVDHGRLVGIITRSDLIAALLHQLGLR
jgi:CBS domain-containing membrane protein